MLLSALLFLAFGQAEAAPAQGLSLSNSDPGNSTFQGTSTSLFVKPAWVSGPHTRSTFGLVFGCVITLSLCIWTTVHVNINHPSENKGWRKHLPTRLIKKLGWACAILIFPEGAMAIAHYERMTAWNLLKEMKKLYDAKEQTFSLHDKLGRKLRIVGGTSHLLIMGGFTIPRCGCDETTPKPDNDDVSRNVLCTMTPHTIKFCNSTPRMSAPHMPTHCTLTPDGVLELARNNNEYWRNPPITSDEVKDKSNATMLTKVFIVWQALWTVVQVIGHHVEALPVTLLELHTCLHVFCALVMFFTWWRKPTDIKVSTIISLSPSLVKPLKLGTEGDVTSPFGPKLSPDNEKESQFFTSSAGLGRLMYKDLCDDKRVWKPSDYFKALSNAYDRLFQAKLKTEGLIIAIVGLIYGVVHLAAWNNTFPSNAEKVLWQISAVVTAIA